MTFIEKLYMLDRVHSLINRKGTGKPTELANRLKVSERTVYNIIAILRDLGAEIYFCTQRNSYCYGNQVKFSFIPDRERMVSAKGGKSYFDQLPDAKLIPIGINISSRLEYLE